MQTTERQQKTGLRGWAVATLLGATVLAGGAGAVHALYARAAPPEGAVSRSPLPAAVAVLDMVDHYLVRENFVGRVEPARETAPAAERQGRVVAIAVDEGAMVSAGDVLARLDTRSLDIERARLTAERAAIEADMALAEQTTNRTGRLIGEGWASGQAHDEARFSLTALGARRDAIDAAIARVDLDLEKSVIRAPFDAQVAARHLDEGVVVQASTPILSLQEIGRPQARIGLPPDRLADLAPGEAVTLEKDGRPIAGRVAAITSAMETRTRTVPLLVDLAPEAGLAMGDVVRLGLERRVEARGAWVPISALSEAERGLWSVRTVVGAEDARTVAREVVEVLHVDGERAFVRGTFADGALVVPVGAHRLGRGRAVAAVVGD